MQKQDIILARATALISAATTRAHEEADAVGDDANFDFILENKLSQVSFGKNGELSLANAQELVASLAFRRREKPELWGIIEDTALDFVARTLGLQGVVEHHLKLRGQFSFSGVTYEGDSHELIAAAKWGAGVLRENGADMAIKAVAVRDLVVRKQDFELTGLRQYLVSGYVDLTLVAVMETTTAKFDQIAQLLRVSLQLPDGPPLRAGLFKVAELDYQVR